MNLCTSPFHVLFSKAMEGYGARVPFGLLLSLSVVAIGLKRVEETQRFQSNVVARQGGSACPRTRPPRCGDELNASGKNLPPLLADDTKPGFLPHAFSRFGGVVEACSTPETRPVPGRGDILIDNSPQTNATPRISWTRLQT